MKLLIWKRNLAVEQFVKDYRIHTALSSILYTRLTQEMLQVHR
ncbi:MAG: hypothetical protein RLZZ243_26 [Bacteroidota bacterium]|jgi:hypothetical protein